MNEPHREPDWTPLARNLLRVTCEDLRKPLWSLRSAAEILARSPRLSPREQEIVAIIAQGAERVEATFRLLLDEIVVGAGPGVPLHRERCSVAAVGEEAIEVARHEHRERPFRHGVGSGFAEWDRARVVQLVTALLAHADEYGVPGAGIHLGFRSGEDAIAAEVTVAPARRGADVVGLRLALARDIARAHGGELRVRHEPAGRLSMTAVLPRRSIDG